MGRDPKVTIDFHLDQAGAPRRMADEVVSGLTASPKTLPSKYFYDERGSDLFEAITRSDEYYLTRAELGLLHRYSDEIARVSKMEELIELGAGVAEKTRTLIEAGLRAGTLRRYLPVEVSHDLAERTARELSSRYETLDVHAVIGDFERHLDTIPHGGRRVVAFLGSTIGNFRDDHAVEFLQGVAELLEPGDRLLLGSDLVKDPARIEAAYNDGQGLTARFNLNILNVVNLHLEGNFDVADFEHVSFYNRDENRIESYLRARRAHAVRLDAVGLEVWFDEGETVWTEVSCKYTRESLGRLLDRAGLALDRWFADDVGDYALSLSRLTGDE